MEKAEPPIMGESFSLLETEVFNQLYPTVDAEMFLRRFTRDDLISRLNSSGILPELEAMGFTRCRVLTERVEPEEHRLFISDESGPFPSKLVEVRLAFARLDLPRDLFALLSINWILLQNPRAAFSRHRPQLPGQDFPGLGLGRRFQSFLVELAQELELHGLENHPQYFHNAVFYHDAYYFADPVRQGEFLAMIRHLSKFPIAVASRAIEEGRLIEAHHGQKVDWVAGAMVCPLARSLRDYFKSAEYEAEKERSLASHSFDLKRIQPQSEDMK